jgi:hypothetical protein
MVMVSITITASDRPSEDIYLRKNEWMRIRVARIHGGLYRSVRPLTLTLLLVCVATAGSAQERPSHQLPADTRLVSDVVFRIQGSDTIRLDLLVPSAPAPAPAIVIVGAGAGPQRSEQLWSEAIHLASLGFISAVIDYKPRAIGTRMPIAAAVSDTKTGREMAPGPCGRIRHRSLAYWHAGRIPERPRSGTGGTAAVVWYR